MFIGIKVIAGVCGDVNDVLASFMKGSFTTNGESPCVPGTGRGVWIG